MEKAPSLWGKKRKKVSGCDNCLQIEKKKPFYNTSERLKIIIRPIIFFKKLSNGHKII